MSQSFAIRRVRHRGAPVYIGEVEGVDTWSANPERIINWLCDGWRSRFNQHRATRGRYAWEDDPANPGRARIVRDRMGEPILVPLGDGDFVRDATARKECSWLAAIPTYVLLSAEKHEDTEWWSATRRRATLRGKGARGGAMPGFRSRHREQQFRCYFNAGRGYTVQKTGRRSGVLVLTGQNPSGHHERGGARWSVLIHFRMSAEVLPNTSVQVDWRARKVVFTSLPPPRDQPSTGAVVGVDLGVAHAVALSDGRFFDLPDVADAERKRALHQRAMARSRRRALAEGRDFRASTRYREHRRLAAKQTRRMANIRMNFAHQASNLLVREHDLIVFEDLSVLAMTRRGTGSRKRGLNRGILASAWAQMLRCTTDKASRSIGRQVMVVPAAYTSQRCHMCGHTARENRKSQAMFRCQVCGWTGNADTNAALNIVADGLRGRMGPALRGGETVVNPVGSARSCDVRTPALSFR